MVTESVSPHFEKFHLGSAHTSSLCLLRKLHPVHKPSRNTLCSSPSSVLSVTFLRFGQALDRLVTVSCTRCRASTSVLSTSCSSRGLRLATGDLILRGASRLDAFSVYPVRTWLLCRAVGTTTDPPAVRPPRSSRTKGSSSQISCARAG